MLSGKTVDKQPCGYVLSAGRPNKVVPEAIEAIKKGYTLVKLKSGWGTPDDDVTAVAAVREALGDDARILIDPNGSWSYETALRIIRKLDKYNLDMIESRFPIGISMAWRAFARRSRLPFGPTRRLRNCIIYDT